MKKVLSGLVGVFMLVALVGSAAYALLSDSASLQNLALSTGTADLLIRLTGDTTFEQNKDVAGSFFDDALVPGSYDEVGFDLQNSATGSDVDMTFSATVPAPATGDWADLKDVVECAVYVPGGDVDSTDAAVSSGWFTLDAWNTAEKDIPGGPVTPGNSTSLVLRCMLPETADNSTAGKSLTGLEFQVTGTQYIAPAV